MYSHFSTIMQGTLGDLRKTLLPQSLIQITTLVISAQSTSFIQLTLFRKFCCEENFAIAWEWRLGTFLFTSLLTISNCFGRQSAQRVEHRNRKKSAEGFTVRWTRKTIKFSCWNFHFYVFSITHFYFIIFI